MPKPGQTVTEHDFLQPGTHQVAAGYAVYGPQTTLVLTVGNGVHMFTLDREAGSFVLTQSDVQIPEDTKEFAINMSNMRHWAPPVREYIDECLAGEDRPARQELQHALGGVDGGRCAPHPDPRRRVPLSVGQARAGKPGKLRLMYEANPMAFLVEQAGGAATNGHDRILDVQPTQLHQRVSVVLGSKNEVDRITRSHREAEGKA